MEQARAEMVGLEQEEVREEPEAKAGRGVTNQAQGPEVSACVPRAERLHLIKRASPVTR